ncbi:MAG: hypothetical protein HY670_08930 [Chloroflexi bacterium]|nr:hypothetical protein [Chloroflexota bacterium]
MRHRKSLADSCRRGDWLTPGSRKILREQGGGRNVRRWLIKGSGISEHTSG